MPRQVKNPLCLLNWEMNHACNVKLRVTKLRLVKKVAGETWRMWRMSPAVASSANLLTRSCDCRTLRVRV